MDQASQIKFPNDTQHLLELGRNGSGKTVAGLFHLSFAPWDKKPYIVWDTKGDEMIEKISRMDGVKNIKFKDPIEKNGLHIIKPLPHQYEEIEDLLWKIHARNNVGMYIDEGYNFGKSEALQALLTQGRSKHIPITILSQRPAWLSRFCFSESSFFQIFSLTDRRDRKIVQEFVPPEGPDAAENSIRDLEQRLPPFHSLWYDVKSDRATLFRPTPPSDDILSSFRSRLAPKRLRI